MPPTFPSSRCAPQAPPLVCTTVTAIPDAVRRARCKYFGRHLGGWCPYGRARSATCEYFHIASSLRRAVLSFLIDTSPPSMPCVILCLYDYSHLPLRTPSTLSSPASSGSQHPTLKPITFDPFYPPRPELVRTRDLRSGSPAPSTPSLHAQYVSLFFRS